MVLSLAGFVSSSYVNMICTFILSALRNLANQKESITSYKHNLCNMPEATTHTHIQSDPDCRCVCKTMLLPIATYVSSCW